MRHMASASEAALSLSPASHSAAREPALPPCRFEFDHPGILAALALAQSFF